MDEKTQKELEILRQFFNNMQELAKSGRWPETKEEALSDEVNSTMLKLERLGE